MNVVRSQPAEAPLSRHHACSDGVGVSPMTELRFHDQAAGLLTHEAFSFIVDHLLKHALRTQEFLTLVIFVLERASRDATVTVDEYVGELARLIRHSVRETDLVGYTSDGMLSLMLESTSGDRVCHVLERLDGPLERFATASTLRISIGAASCPTDAIRLDELLRHAESQRKAAH